MPIPKLFNVVLPQVSKFELKEKVESLKKGSKNTLYFYYSEFLLRANRNPWYKEVLNRGTIAAIDGRGLHWAMWRTMKPGIIAKTYFNYLYKLPGIFRIPIFLILFLIKLIINAFGVFFSLVFKYNYTSRTKNQVILGRDFVYDVLRIAEEKKWKTLVIGASRESDEVTKNLVTRLFPKINLSLWTRQPTSLLMRDQFDKKEEGAKNQTQSKGLLDRITNSLTKEEKILTTNNLFEKFPDLYEAKKFIKEDKPDLILVCIGGGSGKQEFFIDNLSQDPEIKFTLATGIGAAMDHLGTGVKEQKKPAPQWMVNTGLEWLYRVIKLPYRRFRILDSIVTLFFWTTLQEFVQGLDNPRPTVVNILENEKDQVLLVKRKNYIPGNVAYSFVQGQIKKKESPEEAGIREIIEETGLEIENLKVTNSPILGQKDYTPLSFISFVGHGGKYSYHKNFLNFVKYSGKKEPETNWENTEAKWFAKKEVTNYLSADKLADWRLAE